MNVDEGSDLGRLFRGICAYVISTKISYDFGSAAMFINYMQAIVCSDALVSRDRLCVLLVFKSDAVKLISAPRC